MKSERWRRTDSALTLARKCGTRLPAEKRKINHTKFTSPCNSYRPGLTDKYHTGEAYHRQPNGPDGMGGNKGYPPGVHVRREKIVSRRPPLDFQDAPSEHSLSG